LSVVRPTWHVAKRSVVSFYDDQGTHHAAALTYYALMSLFPTLLLAVSLLGLLGEYPATYNAIIGHLRGVVPATTLAPLNAAVRAALKSKGTAATALVIAIVSSLWGYRLPRGPRGGPSTWCSKRPAGAASCVAS
jgi:membrane protein